MADVAILTFTTTNPTCRELTFADLEALSPRVISATATFFKPRTTRSTATQLSGTLDIAACGASATDWLCDYVHVCISFYVMYYGMRA